MVKANINPEGGMKLDPDFYIRGDMISAVLVSIK